MSSGAWMMVVVVAFTVSVLVLIMFSAVRSIKNERTKGRSIWREFSLGLILMMLFFGSWAAHAITEWQIFTDDQLSHGETPRIGNFMSQFFETTLQNWQSEFLELFAFVVLASLYIHKGSGESKDGEENIEASLRRIEEHLGTLPGSAPSEPGENWRLPETPLEVMDATAS